MDISRRLLSIQLIVSKKELITQKIERAAGDLAGAHNMARDVAILEAVSEGTGNGDQS